MANLYEHYNTGDNVSVSFYGDTWMAQTFTPSTSHTITSVKLLLLRYNSPGTITVSIRATTVDGHPTAGPDLCSGTTDGNTLPAWVSGEEEVGEWREISLGDGYELEAGTKYAIVVRLVGDISNNLRWRLDNTSPTYTDGNYEKSLSAGMSWSAITTNDFMFEEWGEPAIITAPTVTTDLATNPDSANSYLNGILSNDGGEACDCGFQWGLTDAYGNTTSTVSRTTGQGFALLITGLTANTVYHFRAFATNTAGTAYGSDVAFTSGVGSNAGYIWIEGTPSAGSNAGYIWIEGDVEVGGNIWIE